MRFLPKLIVLLGYILIESCNEKEITPPISVVQSLFDSLPSSFQVQPMLREVSGIAGSSIHQQHVWAHEDSGNPPLLYLIKFNGQVQQAVYIKGATNADWEDMTLNDGMIYIGDFGDYTLAQNVHTIYTFPEPVDGMDTVYHFEKIKFHYPDGRHDAEALLVDPATKDIYIITKNDNPSLIYKITYPYSETAINTALQIGPLTISGVVSAALAPDVNEILVKTYLGVYHYSRKGQSIESILQTTPVKLPYERESQGEAITFDGDNSGFFTLGEKGLGNDVKLFYYKRK